MDYIDIIMPVYNCRKYIKYAIESVKKQTYRNWKLIIINDKSTDDTYKEIIKNIEEIREKVLVIDNMKHMGVAKSRNLGIQESRNRYIAFLDADDIWQENKLEKQISFMEKNEYAFTYTSYEYLKNENQKKVKIFPASLSYKQALGNTFILTSTVIIDSMKIDKEKIKMPNVESEDTATWWKILRAGNIAYGLKENLTTYRVSKSGLSANKFINIKRTWRLYRRQEDLKFINALYYFTKYIFNATIKRIV